MRTALPTALVLVVLLWGGKTSSQELSTHVYPSEDEIYHALLADEITYQQYLVLQDIITNRLDSTNRHLLDEIPNLDFFKIDSASLKTSLETDQQAVFETDRDEVPSKKFVTGLVRRDFRRYADESGRVRSVSEGRINITDAVIADMKIRKDYDDDKYCAGRSVKFHGKGPMREVIIGNYSKRIGLGTVFGYRGKLFKTSSDLDGNSFLFPENGGQNGVVAHFCLGNYHVRGLGSAVRNEDTRLSSWGGTIQAERFPFEPSVTVGFTTLKNRVSGESVSDKKLALTGRHDYRRGYTTTEACWQMGEKGAFAAVVAEGRHRFRQAEIRYAGWRYNDDYIDLTGGSKAAAMYHDQMFEKIERDYPSKRTGQQGLLVKTIVDLTKKIELANSLLYASFNSDTTNTQWLAQISRKIRGFSAGVDFLSRGRKRGDIESVHRQVRFVIRWRTEKLYLRTYVGYNTATAERDILSFFAGLKYKFDSYGRIELWSNIAEIDHRSGRINRWYAFIRSSIDVIDGMAVALKLSHTYNRGGSTEHRTIVGLDVSCCF